MIYYRPTDGDPHSSPFNYRPRTCFIMTQLGGPIPAEVARIREVLDSVFRAHDFDCIDATSVVTGKDFLLKIWELIVTVPVGVAIVHEEMSSTTIGNIFYELGLLQAYGKETLIVKTRSATIPSDFIRTEYVEAGSGLKERIERFCRSLQERAEYHLFMAQQVENNPLLAIDFLRRAYLLTGDTSLREPARELFEAAGLSTRAKSSVESLLLNSFGRA